ncbi:MAG TPA: hypothetical protein VFJ13_07265, partial [Paracoccaceae bacterium]|nr:hypothetical protein [Paracoccaceae bacterium]
PLLSDGGVYFVEDIHAAYWPHFGGGYRKRRSFIEFAKDLVDDMNCHYHLRGIRHAAAKNSIFGIHFYDSVIVFEKRRIERPRHSERGSLSLAPIVDDN